jgi:hypothetical protein
LVVDGNAVNGLWIDMNTSLCLTNFLCLL